MLPAVAHSGTTKAPPQQLVYGSTRAVRNCRARPREWPECDRRGGAQATLLVERRGVSAVLNRCCAVDSVVRIG